MVPQEHYCYPMGILLGRWLRPCKLLRLGAVSGFGNEYYRQKVGRVASNPTSKAFATDVAGVSG